MDHLNFLAFFCLTTFKVGSVLGDKRLSTCCMYRYMSYFDLRTLHKCSYAFVTLFWDTLKPQRQHTSVTQVDTHVQIRVSSICSLRHSPLSFILSHLKPNCNSFRKKSFPVSLQEGTVADKDFQKETWLPSSHNARSTGQEEGRSLHASHIACIHKKENKQPRQPFPAHTYDIGFTFVNSMGIMREVSAQIYIYSLLQSCF